MQDNTPSLDTSFHDHEMAVETEGDRRWVKWTKEVERIIGIKSLDGNNTAEAIARGDADGYSLDDAYEAYEAGLSPEAYATGAKIARDLLNVSLCTALEFAADRAHGSDDEPTAAMLIETAIQLRNTAKTPPKIAKAKANALRIRSIAYRETGDQEGARVTEAAANRLWRVYPKVKAAAPFCHSQRA